MVKQVYDSNEELEKFNYVYYDFSSNFKVYISLGPQLVVLPSDTLYFLYWDEKQRKWTDENIKDTNVVEIEHKQFYSVSVPKMAPITVMSNYHAEFPYNFFKIRRVSKSQVLFSLETKRNQLIF